MSQRPKQTPARRAFHCAQGAASPDPTRHTRDDARHTAAASRLDSPATAPVVLALALASTLQAHKPCARAAASARGWRTDSVERVGMPRTAGESAARRKRKRVEVDESEAGNAAPSARRSRVPNTDYAHVRNKEVRSTLKGLAKTEKKMGWIVLHVLN